MRMSVSIFTPKGLFDASPSAGEAPASHKKEKPQMNSAASRIS